MQRASSLTDARLALLYDGEGFGGDNTMRAKVIRELIDEIRALRLELQGPSAPHDDTARDATAKQGEV